MEFGKPSRLGAPDLSWSNEEEFLLCSNYDPSDDFEHVIEELGKGPTNKNKKGKDEIPANEIRFVLINLIKVMQKLSILMTKHLTLLNLFLMMPNISNTSVVG